MRRARLACGDPAGLPPRRLVRGRGRGALELPLLDLGRGGRGAARAGAGRVVILGSGPNRIGQGIEFDYCCVHAAQSVPRARLRDGDGQLQPRDGLDRLRHLRPPLLRAARRRGGARDLRARAARRRRRSSSAARRRSSSRARSRRPATAILGTPFDAVDLAEDRERFARALRRARHRRPAVGDRDGSRTRRSRSPSAIGYPVLVRPVVRPRRPQHARLLRAGGRPGGAAARARRVLVDRFLEGARRDRRRRALRRRGDATSPRSCSTSRRRASIRATPRASSRRPRSRTRGARGGARRRPPARAGARRRRAR